MQNRRLILFLVAMTALLLQACGAGSTNNDAALQTALFETVQISVLQTAAAGGGGGQTGGDTGGTGGQPAAPSDTPQPSSTPTITLTFTPSIPYVMVSSDTNCRSGPSITYTLITTLHVGEQAQVIKLFSNDYVLVQNPHAAGDCWLWLQYANTHDFTPYNLPFATQPPTSTPTFTPTPDFDWQGDWHMYASGSDLGTVNVHVSGDTISGSFLFGADTISFTLSLNDSRQKASGTWANSSGPSGTVVWMIKSGNHNQFIGSYDSSGTTFEWCGARSGGSLPSPCLWP